LQNQSRADANWRAAHGGLLLALLALPAFVSGLAWWPWPLLAPLLMDAVLVAVVPPLRRTLTWLQVGRLNGPVLAVSTAIILVSSATLVLYYVLFHPDLHHLAEHLPAGSGVSLVLAGALFSVTNAVLEELIFRGVLLDAFTSQLGPTAAVVIQALAFGVAHVRGYPPGEIGVALAAIYGLMQGLLRQWTGGLAAPVLTHVCADATIFGIVVSAA
jgi:membrane protease YdiL (CAAX protease family)